MLRFLEAGERSCLTGPTMGSVLGGPDGCGKVSLLMSVAFARLRQFPHVEEHVYVIRPPEDRGPLAGIPTRLVEGVPQVCIYVCMYV
jgi:hypothetical protein